MISHDLERKENALKIAERLVEAGRIQNLDDWEEMKLEMQFALNESGWEEADYPAMLQAVKDYWYSE